MVPAGLAPIAPLLLCAPSSAVGFMLAWISALAGPGATGWSGTHLLQTLDDHLVAERDAAGHGGDGGGRLPELDPALFGLVVGADDKDIFALLIRQHRGARNRQHFDRLRRLPARR